jgi:deferrochelatase/peroxidase EfeB
MTNSPVPPYQPGNVQGLILRGYTHPHSCHMLFKFKNRAGAAGFTGALLPYVQSAEEWSDKPERMLNIGLTFNGILTLEPALAPQFPVEFKAGPWSVDSQRSLQDTGASDPKAWWNGQDKQAIHCIVHVYGMTVDALGSLVTLVSQAAWTNSVSEILPLTPGGGENGRLQQYAPLKNVVHFGYRDSIDNPGLGWPADPAGPAGHIKSDPGDANNFLIGYPEAGSEFHPGPISGPAGEFAKDGCYNAFRVLYQDVRAFDQFLADTAPTIVAAIGGSEDHAKEWLAAKLVGRWRNGSPLVLSPEEPCSTTAGATDFLYKRDDDDGLKCPFSAHSRVANPRDQSIYDGDAPVPRLLRRGVPYGAPPAPPDYDGERGLIGLFLCGALAGQFEMLYSWININGFSEKFAPDLNTQDALLANRGAAGDRSFTIAITKEKKIRIPSLPQFIVTRGTAYCLLPSMKTLRRIAGLSE